MADLLTMVNTLIGFSVVGNLYNFDKQYNGLLYVFKAPTLDVEQGLNTLLSRQEIYTKSNSPDQVQVAPTDIPVQVSSVQANSNFSETYSFSDAARNDLYAFHQNAVRRRTADALPNGIPISQPSLGDTLENQGKPPVEQLWKVKNGDNANTFAPPQGQIESKTFYQGNDYDDQGFDFLKRVGPFKFFGEGIPAPLNFFDIGAIAHWLRNVGREVYFLPRPDADPITGKSVGTTPETISKSSTWLASQFLLAALNPGDPQAYGLANMLWNPLSLPAASIPGIGGQDITAITVGPAFFGNYLDNITTSVAGGPETGLERMVMMRNGLYSQVAPGERLSKLKSPVAKPGYIGDLAAPGSKRGNNLEDENIPLIGGVTVAQQVDGDGIAQLLGVHTNLYNADRPYGPKTAIMPQEVLENVLVPNTTPEQIKLSSLFVQARYAPNTKDSIQPKSWLAKSQLFADNGVPQASQKDSPNAQSSDALNANFLGEDPITNLISANTGKGQNQSKGIPENEIYFPFMFEDLRKINSTAKEQFLYFRAFLKSGLSELFSPDWQRERYYGRVDQVPTYMGTDRNINISFDVVAWKPADLPIVWNKMRKLQSMVYPMYDTKGFISAGPIIRMRVGDLLATTDGRGLPGYITSMDWQYDDGVWNLLTDWKTPRKISVTLGFTVLHEGNPGIYPYGQATIDSQGNVNQTNAGDTDSANNPLGTFGVGTFVTDKNGITTVTVSSTDIRKIFGGQNGSGNAAGGG